MSSLQFSDIISALTHIRGGIPALRLSSRIRLAEHRSLFFGPSNDFYDIKEFDPDIDPANMKIDLEGEEDVEYARRTIEPHEINIKFIVDLSPSIYTGLDLNRRRMLLEAIGFIGLTGVRYMDPVGLIGFTDKIVLNMPTRSGPNNFYYLLKTVYDFMDRNDPFSKKESSGRTDFFVALDFIRKYFTKPCFIPVISDFVGFEKVIDSPLLRYVASRHEMIFVFLDDPLEFFSAQGRGYVSMDDPESGERRVISRRDLTSLESDLRSSRRKLRKEKLARMGIHSVVLEYASYGRHFNRLHRFFMARHKLQGRQV